MAFPSSQSWSSITRYDGTNTGIINNDVERLGFDSDLSETEMIALAIKHQCPLIVRSGIRGKWYLKGRGREHAYLEGKLISNKGVPRYKRAYVLLIKLK
jgi:hypothetical protein